MDTLFPINLKEDKIKYDFNKVKTYPVNIHHKSNYDTFIGRGSKWGNPWSHIASKYTTNLTDTREEAIMQYFHWLLNNPELLADISELQGKTLGCFCYPNLCHGDILGLLADSISINENILSNKKFVNSLMITESQLEILDNRRLSLLLKLTNLPIITLKKSERVIGYKSIKNDELEEESFLGKGVYMYNADEIDKANSRLVINEEYKVVKIEWNNVHLVSIYDELNESTKGTIFIPTSSVKILETFENMEVLREHIKSQPN